MREIGRAEQTVRFGVFEVNLRSGELRKAGVKIKLQEQPFKVLTALLEHPGEVVTREELRNRIWPQEGFGDFDHAVNIAVAKLRAALGDSVETPRLIETLHRRGYRFIFPIASTHSREQATPGGVPASVGSGGVASHSGVDISSAVKVVTYAPPPTSGRSPWVWIGAVLVLVLAWGGTFAWLSRPLPPPRVLSTTQITHDGFTKTNALSDGFRLYIAETTGSKHFLVQVSVAGGDSSVIPTPFTNIAISDVSPDHSQLLVADAVGTETEGQAWILPIPAGAPRRLGNIIARRGEWASGWAVWSPLGHQLAFAKGSEIYMANAEGTDVRKLVTLPDSSEGGYAETMCFSPDATHLRFNIRKLQSDSSSIWEVRSDGTDLHPLLPGWHSPPSEFAGVWSPDGRYYFFTSATSPNTASIWAIREAAGLFPKRASPPVQLTTGPMPVFLNGISADGKRLLADGWSTRSELVRYNARSHRFAPVLGGISAGELDFSQDGKWVAYVSYPDGALWRSRIDGNERLQLTSAPVSAFLPRWSPDGTQIAYVDDRPGSLWKIFLISAQGGTPQELLSENQNQLDPSWSPDGKKLVFGRVPWLRAGTEEIALQILDVNSKQVSTIPGSENLFAPRWSPDGKYLVALSTDSKRLLRYGFKTKEWSVWINEPGTVGYPTWSRDGRHIYYDNTSTKGAGYRRAEVGQTRSEFLIDLKGLPREASHLTVPLGPWSGIAPDGSALFVRNLSTDEIYALEVELP
jgi:Tol biopolymer transport system component/DNA-binding winged helix-turn-helix (wHTH) protein